MARRTKEEALATRHRLLDAAELLFQAQGVSQTTLQQIAQQAGATRGAIYWHFKDKADLFNAMMERVILPLETSPRAAATAPGVDDPLAEIEEGMVHALTLMTTDPQVRRVFDIATHKVEYVGEMDAVRTRHVEWRSECLADIERALKRAKRGGDVPAGVAPKSAAVGLLALFDGLLLSWMLDRGSFDLPRAGEQAFAVYLAGLGVCAST